MRYLFLAILLIHGLIHLLGFNKAFRIRGTSQLTKPISRPEGLLWLFVALLFVFSILPFIRNQSTWAVMALVAVVISQVLILGAWHDAKYGTIVNVIILLVALPVIGSWNFENTYRADIKKAFRNIKVEQKEFITQKDLDPLSYPVQKYLKNI